MDKVEAPQDGHFVDQDMPDIKSIIHEEQAGEVAAPLRQGQRLDETGSPLRAACERVHDGCLDRHDRGGAAGAQREIHEFAVRLGLCLAPERLPPLGDDDRHCSEDRGRGGEELDPAAHGNRPAAGVPTWRSGHDPEVARTKHRYKAASAGPRLSGIQDGVTAPPQLMLFARYPEPGKAKTRLIPALGPQRAAALHRRMTEQSISVMRATGLAFQVRVTGAAVETFREWLGADVYLADQGGGDLGERLARAGAEAPVVLLGADTPDLKANHLIRAAETVSRGHAVIGPAQDGGYWLLGLPEPMPFLFTDIPWSTETVGAITIQRLTERGIRPVVLETLADLDRPEDLSRWPDLAR